MRRCYDPHHVQYHNYGGRGIVVCERWRGVRQFIEDIEREIGARPPRVTLDRRDNNGNYEPGNVRWATWSEQRRNQQPRRYANLSEVLAPECRERRAAGESQRAIARELGVSQQTVWRALKELSNS
jgi:DNA invertase Pin-like site-specific DNA recombinase